MPEEGHAEALAASLLAGVEHLRKGQPSDAAAMLRAVCADPDLAAAEDLVDVRARAHSLLAQALTESGAHDEALAALDAAEALAATLADPDATPILTSLRDRIEAARADGLRSRDQQVRSERLAALSMEEIEARLPSHTPEARLDVMIRKANAEVDVGRPAEGLLVAREALTEACTLGDLRLEVLARLSIARASPEQAHEQLHRAWRRADAASETTLITAVAKAAEAHGVQLDASWELG
ncbi:MAG: hypothetical protein KTR31_07220 [Myxococcales bacterium]|nr:hypothetical protein [Myxococcales bacterium]